MNSPLLDTYEQFPFTVSHGNGAWIYDTNGTKYLDMYGGHAVALLGHCHPAIVKAVQIQSEKLFFYSNLAPLAIRNHGAKKLTDIAHESMRHVFFCNSGAEANDNALKMAIRLTGRSKLVSYTGSFHGRSLLTTAVTDAPKTHQELGAWCEGKVTFLTPNDASQFNQITNETAAVILEPIQSMGGVTSFTLPYLAALKAHCEKTGTILIFDEVQTGFGRTGDPFISGFCGVTPDIFTTAKGIASGYPVGAMFVTDAIAAKVKTGDLGSTYGAGPVAMAAIIATVDTLVEQDLFRHAKKLDEAFKACSSIPGVVEVRGGGCLIGLKTTKPAKDVMKALLEKQIITGTSKDPNVLRLLPPIIITDEHINIFKSALREVLA